MQTLAAIQTSQPNGADAGTAPPPRLVKAAHEFEAQLMKELMAPLTKAMSVPGLGASEDEDSQDSGSGGALAEFASEALGKALSEAGGFGIAKQILREIGHTGGRKGNQGQAASNPKTDTIGLRSIHAND
jgi:Rod binding domain-containing protein